MLTGHAYVQAWYYCLYKALDAAQGNGTDQAKDDARARANMLLHCGLSATLHVRSELTKSERACWSIAISEARKNDNELNDTFLTFSRKPWRVIGDGHLTMQDRIKKCADLKIRFAGAVISKQLMSAIQHMSSPASSNEDSLQTLRHIELLFGRGVLSSSYTKLVRIT